MDRSISTALETKTNTYCTLVSIDELELGADGRTRRGDAAVGLRHDADPRVGPRRRREHLRRKDELVLC